MPTQTATKSGNENSILNLGDAHIMVSYDGRSITTIVRLFVYLPEHVVRANVPVAINLVSTILKIIYPIIRNDLNYPIEKSFLKENTIRSIFKMSAVLKNGFATSFQSILVLLTVPVADAATNTFNFSQTTLAATTGPINPANGATAINGASLTAGDVVVLDCLVANVTGTQSDNWGAVNLNQGGFLGVTGATLGVLARSGNVNVSTLYVNGVAISFTGSTAALTNRVRIELYVSTTGATTNLGYRVLIDVGATGTPATTFTQAGTNLTFAGNSIALTFSAYTVSESFMQNLPLTGALTSPSSLIVVTNLTATFTASVTNAVRTIQQWHKNGVLIANATNLVYTTPLVSPADNGAVFDLVITNAFLPANVVTSSPAMLTVRTNGPGTTTVAFPATTLAAGSGPSNPSNTVVSISGSQLEAGDTVVFDATIANTSGTIGDNWGSLNLNRGSTYGLLGAALAVLARTGNAAGYTCDLYVNAAGPTHFAGTSEVNTNRVVINLYVTKTGSTTNLGYQVYIDQGLSGAFTSSLSGTNVTFAGNTINLTFSAHNANELFMQNPALTGVHLQLPDTNLLAGASEQSSVTVDSATFSNAVPWFNPGFIYATSDNNVMSVSSNGLLQAVGNGTATVSVSVGNLSDTKIVTVTNVSGALLDVRLLVASKMALFGTQQAGVRGDFANVADVDLLSYGQPVFTVANTNLLAVSGSGLITATGPGADSVNVSYGGLSSGYQPITVTFPTNRFIFDTFSDGFWAITNAANGYVLTVSSSGASQEIYTNGAADQQFELLYDYQNSTFRIRQRSSWQCIGPLYGNTAVGAAVVALPTYSGITAQQWYFVDAGGGCFRLVNPVSGLALQTDNGNPASVTMAPASSNAVQLWNFSYQTHYPKKGCAGYEEDYAQFGLDWAYNYGDRPSTNLPASVDFVPMIYDATYWEPLSDAQSLDSGWLDQAPPDYLLAYNEPDNPTQSNTSTNSVIGLWPQIQALNLPIVSPAVQNTFDSWQYNFYSLIASNSYRVDYSAVHEYVPPNSTSLISELNSVYTTFGRPVWLTEFSPVDWSENQGWTEDDDYNFLAEFMWLAEGNEWLKRYAIFPFSGTNPVPPYQSATAGYRGNFFLADGVTLAPYGELYAAWDGNTNLQTRTPYFVHNLGTSFRLTSTNAATPQPATIYTRDSSAQWALLPSPATNQYYIISLKDGRRLRNNGGTPDLAPYCTTGPAVQWWMNGPDSEGYYYIDNLSASQSVQATGTAPAISFSMVNDPAPSSATQWRLIKPYDPVTIVTAAPPVVSITYSNQSVTLNWSGNGMFYNVYRSVISSGSYTEIASLVTNTAYLDGTVQNGTAYFYVVTALNVLGEESAYSGEVVAHPASTVPQPIGFNLVTYGAQNGIQFKWPADHTGWRLMMNTNGLGNSNAWFTVANSAATNQIWLPFEPSQNSVFFQLVFP